jgi:superfamily I DNA and/or RNA helicase
MDENKYILLLNGKDKTSDVESIKQQSTKVTVKFFNSDKQFTYNKSNVVLLNNPSVFNHNNYLIYLGNRCLSNIEKILDFDSHVKVFYIQGKVSSYLKSELAFKDNVLASKSAKHILEYLKELSSYFKNEENDFLYNQYEKIKVIDEESVLAKYLKPNSISRKMFDITTIFPFGFNLSQEEAVVKALTNQISIIEGPPGTGKTQTILNILANLVMNDKSVAIVSNNNTAMTNVFEKLDAEKLSFFSAVLGNKENKDNFFNSQNKEYPEYKTIDIGTVQKYTKSIEKSMSQIKEMLKNKNHLAKLSLELEELKIEKKYFMELYEKRKLKIEDYKKFTNYKLDKILSLWAEIEEFQRDNKQVSLYFKIKSIFKYKIFTFSFYDYPLDDIIIFLQYCFYMIKEIELTFTIQNLEKSLSKFNFDKELSEHRKKSMDVFKSYLLNKYNMKDTRKQFNSGDLWNEFDNFIKEYPVIFSTTHSLQSSTGPSFLYDYLIIDEASQVDILSGSLALSCAKNVVVVGDLQQLPHIVKSESLNSLDGIFKSYNLHSAYNYQNSLLLSTSMLFDDAPKTLLKEHYRCNPKIIDFCNKKFYNNELVILSKSKTQSSPLYLYSTLAGNHARGTYNQRQIDVIQNEILPKLKNKDIGIISPFRKQVSKLSSDIDDSLNIEIDTVHKYQGREKDIIIITTVVNKENEFADNENLLNVAISRAKDQLHIVVSDDEKNKNMKDLINYIKYNNFEVIQSEIYSIFDLLYKNYSPYIDKSLHNAKNVSKFKSENLMNGIIEKVLFDKNYSNLDKIFNLPLNRLIKDTSLLTLDEQKFSQNDWSHLDFLIYNKINKPAVLAIEVDGVQYHENNPAQLKRDNLKDNILKKYNIPIIRFPTNGSEEEKKLRKKLKDITTTSSKQQSCH